MFYDVYSKLCHEKGVSKSKAAESVGLNRTSVIKWKKGSSPSGETLEKFAKYFNVSFDYLLGNTDQKEKPTAKSDELIDPIDQKILDLLKKLNPRDKAAIMAQIDALANLPSDKED